MRKFLTLVAQVSVPVIVVYVSMSGALELVDRFEMSDPVKVATFMVAVFGLSAICGFFVASLMDEK